MRTNTTLQPAPDDRPTSKNIGRVTGNPLVAVHLSSDELFGPKILTSDPAYLRALADAASKGLRDLEAGIAAEHLRLVLTGEEPPLDEEAAR
jgi:hypothetical protein